jgi:hypothetical protein
MDGTSGVILPEMLLTFFKACANGVLLFMPEMNWIQDAFFATRQARARKRRKEASGVFLKNAKCILSL